MVFKFSRVAAFDGSGDGLISSDLPETLAIDILNGFAIFIFGLNALGTRRRFPTRL